MKKNLLMLLCAVSLLANTVQADTTVADVIAAENKGRKPAKMAMHDFDSKGVITDAGIEDGRAAPNSSFFSPSVSNYWNGAYGGGLKDNWLGHTSRGGHRLTGRVPHGASHASRLVNALLLADVLGRDTNSFVGRGIGSVGRGLGFHRKAKDWRRGAYNAMTSRSKLARTLRALSALGLAGVSDAALARMVGDSSAIGAGYRGIRGLLAPKYVPTSSSRRTVEEARKHLGLDAPAPTETIEEDAGGMVPLFGDEPMLTYNNPAAKAAARGEREYQDKLDAALAKISAAEAMETNSSWSPRSSKTKARNAKIAEAKAEYAALQRS